MRRNFSRTVDIPLRILAFLALPFLVGCGNTGGTAAVSLSKSALMLSSQGVGTASAPQSLAISNVGTAALTIASIGTAAPFAQNSNCPTTLPPGSNCIVNVTFTPKAAGTQTGMLSVTDDASANPQTVSLTGTVGSSSSTGSGSGGSGSGGSGSGGSSGSPSASVAPTSLSFSSQYVGSASSPQLVVLSNSGSAALSISAIGITGTNSGDFSQSNNCGSSVPPGSQCSINVTFTPAAAGTASAQLAVNDNASGSPQTVALSGTGQASPVPIIILTNSTHNTNQGAPYSGQMKATGGAPPYTWSVTSGQLPGGLQLNPSTGAITGMATAAGNFSFRVQVQDTLSSQVTKSFAINVANPVDAYGGTPSLPCPSGPATNFYTQKIGNRWWLCTPAGNAFWMQSVYVVDTDDAADSAGISYTEAAQAKYGDTNVTWGPQQNRRLLAWGFNSQAEYSSAWVNATQADASWPGGTQPVLMPFVGIIDASYYTLSNEDGYASGPVKDLVNGILPSVYNGYRAPSPDIYDPNYQMWIDNFLQKDPSATSWINGPNNSYFIGFNVDDIDYLLGYGAGPDFDAVVNGVLNGGYAEPNLAWLVLVTSPTQTSNSQFDVTYSDTTVYAKQALSNFLSQEYGTIAALDLAWGATYTTFGQGTGLLAGTGLMDEVGLNPWIPTDYLNLSDAPTAMQQDLNNFLLAYMKQYFSTIKGEINLRAPGRLYLGPTTLGSWGAPARQQVLQAASSYLDILVASSIPEGASDDQQKMDFIEQNLGDKPWLEWEGFVANSDSDMSAYSPSPTVQAASNTQAQRGTQFTNMVNTLLNAQTTSGSYPVVGYKWWRFTDDPGEEMNWGLVTVLDNEYDGLAAVTGQGSDAWGYATGGESASYGDFLNAVISANQSILPCLLSKTW